MKAGFSVTES